jgi:hypothetical protein
MQPHGRTQGVVSRDFRPHWGAQADMHTHTRTNVRTHLQVRCILPTRQAKRQEEVQQICIHTLHKGHTPTLHPAPTQRT